MAYHACKSYGRYHGLTGATIPPLRLLMVPLIAAAVLGGSLPVANADFDPPGPDAWCATDAISNPFCQISQVFTTQVFKLPELGGLFTFVGGEGQFTLGTDDARLTGVVESGSGAQFSFSVVFSGAKPVNPSTADFLVRCGATTNGWIQFTGTSGELVGLPGSFFDGARYAIKKRSGLCSNDSNISCTVATQEADCGVGNTCNLVNGADAQFGLGADTHDINLGLFARIDFELIEGNGEPLLPVGPFRGEVSVKVVPAVNLSASPVDVNQSCFPPAEPDLTGTWTGTIDCVGFDAEAGPAATPVENFFSAATLLIGRSTNPLDVGNQYSVRLTRETGNAQSFCAYAPNNPGSTTGGQGVLVEPQRQATRVHFKFEGETLKARELIADGLHGTQLCKWSFTRASTTPPAVADACPPAGEFGCFAFGVPSQQCNDDAVCGQTADCIVNCDFSCTCKDGFVGSGFFNNGCTPAP